MPEPSQQKPANRLWQISWRLGLCSILLVWIFHSIFVNEARLAASKHDWTQLSRLEQWKRGWHEGPAQLWQTITLAQPGWLIVSLVLMAGTLFLGVVRWRLVLEVQGLHLPFRRATEISLVAHFFNSFLLGSTGGDLMKAYYAARETHHKKTEAVVTVFVDRLVGLWAMLLFAGMMMLLNLRTLTSSRVATLASLLILGMLSVCSFLGVLAFRGGVSRRWGGARAWLRRLPKGASLERSLDSCRLFGRQRLFLTRTLLISMALNVVCVLQWQVVGFGLGVSIPPLTMLAIVPMVICIAALPITPSGLGVRETLFVNMLNDPKLATSALTLSLLAYGGSLFWSLVGGVVYLLLKEKHHLARSELESQAD
ncbi:MAG TPA: lysylphosphatidylglycerol synthase transmembrane domain-containing protein [Verrucomicrobiae bacterium]|nr:lysylphosphatidylglycerol synthase transmembrane domain-containing protein [Verrucomicrobiae bacterium]